MGLWRRPGSAASAFRSCMRGIEYSQAARWTSWGTTSSPSTTTPSGTTASFSRARTPSNKPKPQTVKPPFEISNDKFKLTVRLEHTLNRLKQEGDSILQFRFDGLRLENIAVLIAKSEKWDHTHPDVSEPSNKPYCRNSISRPQPTNDCSCHALRTTPSKPPRAVLYPSPLAASHCTLINLVGVAGAHGSRSDLQGSGREYVQARPRGRELSQCYPLGSVHW